MLFWQRIVTIILFVWSTSLCASVWHWHDDDDDSLWSNLNANFSLLSQVSSRHYVNDRQQLLRNKTLIYHISQHAQPFLGYIYDQVQQRGMPAEIALLPAIESEFHPFAYSSSGATGLWQLMPGTAAGYKMTMDWWFDGRRDVIQSTRAALSYLQYLHGFFHDWLLAIAAYNAGQGRVLRAIQYNIRHHRSISFWSLHLPKETTAYVPKLLAMADIIAHSQRYAVRLAPITTHPAFAQVALPKRLTLAQAAKLVGISEKVFRTYNAGFRRADTGQHWHNVIVPSTVTMAYLQRLAHYQTNTLAHDGKSVRVQPGDTLSDIAHRAGCTVKQIMRLNHLKSTVIRAGQILRLPARQPVARAAKQLSLRTKAITEEGLPGPKHIAYRIKRGDTLGRLANRYAITPAQIKYWNPTFRHHLPIGKTLHLWLPKHRRVRLYSVKSGDTLGGDCFALRPSVEDTHARQSS